MFVDPQWQRVSPGAITAYRHFTEQFFPCTSCSLHKTACEQVIFRGSIPADMLLIGDAPGRSEDVIGFPLVGPEGNLLDEIILDAKHKSNRFFQHCITTTVCCLPLDFSEDNQVRDPLREEAVACSPRLEEFVRIVAPKLVVRVGPVAKSFVKPKYLPESVEIVDITHPTAILNREDEHQSGPFKKAVSTLVQAVKRTLR